MATTIDVRQVTKRFGNVLAVDRCSLKVEQGTITGLIGPNGAGKTTMFNMVAGAFAPTSGQILLDGQDVTGLPAHELFARGLLRTFQIAQEFSHMTALENLMMVPAGQSGESVFNAFFRRGRLETEELATRRQAEDVLQILRLTHVKNEKAGNLSGGQKKLLELGRVMMTDARVVLLDEIAAGVNRTLLNDLAAVIERLNREKGLTFFVIEHDMDLIARLCDPVIVMAAGSVMMQGPMADIRNNPEVVEAYFGGGAPVAESGIVALLEMTNIHGGYGGANILNGVSIAIEAHEIGVIVGPNGAGKSTTLKALFGLLKVSEGNVLFGGGTITNHSPEKLVRAGLSFVPQEFNVFPTMSVQENLEMGAYIRRDDYRRQIDQIYGFFPPLKDKRKQPAGELSGGQRQMVAIGRALMTEPKLLLLDEPTAGLSPRYMGEIFERIIEVNKSGVGILMVEQNARQALAIAHRGFVLAGGQNRFTGTGAELLADPEVAKSFLGGGA